MTKLHEAEESVLSEVSTVIKRLTPNVEQSQKFYLCSTAEMNRSDFEKPIDRNRAFFIGLPEQEPQIAFGKSEFQFFSNYPVTLRYMFSEDWRRWAYSDCELITRELQRTQATTAGVQSRVIWDEKSPQFEKDGSDPWFNMILTLRVHYSITG